jgi:hypothetical protein
MNPPIPPTPKVAENVPQNYMPPQTPAVLQNMIPQQGVINTQPDLVSPQQ